jgi:hypothetical protein
MALEKIKQIEKELESMMKLYGRAGLWDDWIRHQAEARKQRRLRAIEEKRRKEQMWEYIGWFIAFCIIVVGIIGLVAWLKWLRDGVLW